MDEGVSRRLLVERDMVSWTDCQAVEAVPGKVSGAPVIRGTRVRPDDLLVNREEGVQWLSENFGVTPEVVHEVFRFYDAHRPEIRAPAS